MLSIETGQSNPILRQKAEEIKQINAQIKQLALDMVETLEAHQGLGLAAPQVNQSLRLIVVKPEPGRKALILINPKIKKASRRKTIMQEGCLSLPDVFVAVERSEKITVEALDINGQTIKIKAKGLLARVIQHEIDHLDGILIVDKS
jgi:peptide deformylase